MFQKAPFPFFTNANGTQKFFSIKCFSKRWGWAQGAHASAKRLTPFFGKTFCWKEHLCTVSVCKKWDWRFLKHLAVLTVWICACLSIFSWQKDWIRIFWTFIDSKKVNPCFFLLVRSAKKFNLYFLSFFMLPKTKFMFFKLCKASKKLKRRIFWDFLRL